MKRLAFWFVWVFVFTIPWENVIVIPGVGTLSRLIGFLALIIGIGWIIVAGKIKVHRFLGWAAVFILWGWITFFWSIDPQATLTRAFTYTQLLFAVGLIYQFSGEGYDIKALMVAYVFGACVAILGIFWEYTKGYEVAYNRFALKGFDPNDFSFYLNFAIVIAGYLGINKKASIKLFTYLFVFLASIAVFLTASRGGFIGWALAVIYFLINMVFVKENFKMQNVLAIIILILFGSYVVLNFIPSYVLTRISTIPEEITKGTLNYRTIIWDAGIEIFLNHPFLGVGAGAFRSAVLPIIGISAVPHNVFLSILVEEGIIGFIFFVGMLSSAFFPIFIKQGINRRLGIFFFLVLMVAFFSLNFEWRKITWFIMVLTVLICKMDELR
jgi:O-antigen ligase